MSTSSASAQPLPSDPDAIGGAESAGFAVSLPALELTPVRVSRDQRHLVLIDEDGTEYSVPLATGLRGMLGDAPAGEKTTSEQKGQKPMNAPATPGPSHSSLRPRDIQQRIRAGETVAQVAAVAGVSEARVMIYAGPVLAEREHVAQTALTASVRRQSASPDSSVRTVGVASEIRLREAGLDPELDVTWDAWRRADGKWTLQAAYTHQGHDRVAAFTLDQPGRFVIADNDEARWLIGDGHFDLDSHREAGEIGDDAIEMVSADADWIAHGPGAPVVPAAEPAPPAPAEPIAETPSAPVVVEADETTTELPLPGMPDAGEPTTPRRQRPKRSSVPSWDEIMFGGPTE